MKENKKKSNAQKTKRLRLVPMTEEELARRAEAEADAHMKSAYLEMLEGVRTHAEQSLWYTAWRMERLLDGVTVGDLCFKGAPNDLTIEIGYGVDEPYRAQGYCSEALTGMTEWAFAQTGVYYIQAKTEPGSDASAHILEKAGFADKGETNGERLWELEKPKSAWMSIYMCLGLSIGLSLGMTVFDNMAIGMCVGMALGVAVGSSLDAADKKARVRQGEKEAEENADGGNE